MVALHATAVGDELHVDLYGGHTPVCASVRFTRAATPLTLVRIGRSVTLTAL